MTCIELFFKGVARRLCWSTVLEQPNTEGHTSTPNGTFAIFSKSSWIVPTLTMLLQKMFLWNKWWSLSLRLESLQGQKSIQAYQILWLRSNIL